MSASVTQGNSVRRYFMLLLGAIFASVGLEIFLVPNHVIDGGVVGISIMMESLTDIPYAAWLVALNLPFIYMGWRHIGWRFALGTVLAVAGLSAGTAYLEPVPGLTEDVFLATIFGGIIDGIGVGLIIRNGGSLDGTEIVGIIMEQKSGFSVGELVMGMNVFILGAAGFLFGWDRAMYSLLAYFVIARTIDVVVKGLDQSYAVIIVTGQQKEVVASLMEMGHGVTVLKAEGGFSGAEFKALYVVVSRLELSRVKEIVLGLDERAFISIHAVSEIVGGSGK